MVIDAHVHLPTSAKELDYMIKFAEEFGIQKLCVSSLGRIWKDFPSVDEVRQANEDVSKAIKKYLGKILGYCYLNPNYVEIIGIPRILFGTNIPFFTPKVVC